jgi:hypothetical protein
MSMAPASFLILAGCVHHHCSLNVRLPLLFSIFASTALLARERVTRVTRMAYSPSPWLMANWLVKQNQPVSKIETKSDTNLRSLYES